MDSGKKKKSTAKNSYIGPHKDLFVEREKPLQDFSEQKQRVQNLVDSFRRLKIKAKIVSVAEGAKVCSYVFHSQNDSAVSAIKQYMDVIENDLGVFGIRVTENYCEYDRCVFLGKEEYFKALEGGQSKPFMNIREGGYFVNLEIPHSKPTVVSFRDFFEEPSFMQEQSCLAFPLGTDVEGKAEICKLDDMPHLFIAGASGSGKTICINSIIAGLVTKNPPEDVKLMLFDAKCVELGLYEGLPHSLTKRPINELSHAIKALEWVVGEIERRLSLFWQEKVTNIKEYRKVEKMPYIVVVIDEFCDLMLRYKKETDQAISKICQKGRAAGVHLVASSQRSGAQIFSGVVRANMTASIAFQMFSPVDSKIFLGTSGAEKLSGSGDMLFMSPFFTEPKRMQGCYISSAEVSKMVEFVKQNNEAIFDANIEEIIFGKEDKE